MVISKKCFDFQEMSNISKDLREKLEKQCIIDTFEIQENKYQVMELSNTYLK